jgi:hypothetical protein
MKGSSIIMAAWELSGRRRLKGGRKNRDDNAGVLNEMEWWIMRAEERRGKGQQHCIYSTNA